MGRLMRRSGNAVTLTCMCIGWRPKVLWHIGVGINHQEIDCLLEKWPDIQVIGFEPHPEIYNSIKDKYPGTLLNKAVSYRDGEATLYSKPKHKDGSSLHRYYDETNNQKPIRVETVALNSLTGLRHQYFTKENEGGHLLWLDCEGNELRVLRGSPGWLRAMSAVNVEMTGVPLGSGWPSPLSVHQYLTGYSFYAQMIHTNRIDSGQYDAFYVSHRLFSPHYCNCPSEVNRYH